MRTWQMIKALTENPELKFKRISDGIVLKLSSKISDGIAVDLYIYLDMGEENNCETVRLHDEWELVQEPVDFMTAANSGKRISGEGWDSYYFLHEVLHILQNRDNALDLINGKWLIED